MQSFMKWRTQSTDLPDSWLLCDWSRICILQTNVTNQEKNCFTRERSYTSATDRNTTPDDVPHRVQESGRYAYRFKEPRTGGLLGLLCGALLFSRFTPSEGAITKPEPDCAGCPLVAEEERPEEDLDEGRPAVTLGRREVPPGRWTLDGV